MWVGAGVCGCVWVCGWGCVWLDKERYYIRYIYTNTKTNLHMDCVENSCSYDSILESSVN